MRERDGIRQEIQEVAVAAWILILGIIFFDQITKAFLATSCNTGVAFGFLQSWGLLNIIAPIVILLGCFYFLIKQKRQIVALALGLVIGGGVSNLIDRLTSGCVRDFIDLTWLSPRLTWLPSSLTRWPSFNLADSAVTVGALILIWVLFVKSEPKNYDDTNHRSE